MKTENAELVSSAAAMTSVAGAGLTIWSWLTSGEFLGFAGFLLALGGFLVNIYFKREANRRHAAEHALKMERLRRGLDIESECGSLGVDK